MKRTYGIAVMSLAGALMATALGSPSAATTSSGSVISSVVMQVEKVETPGTWINATSTFEGTPSRAVVSVSKTGAATVSTVTIRRSDGVVLGSVNGPLPKGTTEVTVPLNLEGTSWASVGNQAPSEVLAEVSFQDGSLATEFVDFAIAPRPVVLLHGLWSEASTWSRYQGFVGGKHPLWRAYAVGDGQFTGTMDTGELVSPKGRPNTVDQNASEAWNYVSALRNSLNAREIDVIGHSMGGIIARRMLHAQGQSAQDAIREVVMLGTPNGGSYCANLWSVPATAPLIPSVMRDFNAANPGYPGVGSTLVYAEHLAPTCLDFSWGDSVVPRWSAKAVNVDQFFIAEPTLHSNMTGDRSLFDRFVVPALARPATISAPAGSTPGGGNMPDEETIGQLAREGSAAGGEKIDIPILITAGEKLSANVVSGPGAELSLVAPNGTIIPLVPDMNGLPVYSATLPVAQRKGTAYLRGQGATSLDWALSVTGSDLVMDASVQEQGDGVIIKADLTDPEAGDAVRVRAQVIDESRDDRRWLTLVDDGASGDTRSGDDMYTVEGTIDSEANETVRVEVTATFSDGRQRTVIVGYIDEAA